MTNEEHNKFIAYVHLAHGGFQLLMMAFIGLMFYFILSIPTGPGRPGPPAELFAFMFVFMFVFQMLFTAPAFVAAYALLTKKSWARMASIIAGIMGAMHVPVGTAACVYSLWFFFGENWKSIYPHSEEAQIGAPGLIAAGDASRWTGEYQTNEQGEERFHPASEPPDWR